MRYARTFGIIGFLLFAIFVINQTAQAVALANTISPAFGRVVLILLLLVYAAAILTPILLIARLPKRLHPVDERSPEFGAYLDQLSLRLATNPSLVGGIKGNDRAAIEAALKQLDARAEGIVKQSASSLFVSTAISQNGSLDGIMVLTTQVRMVWQVAHIYNQRPSLVEMAELYGNVGAAVFVAGQLESIDIASQIDPLIRAAIGPAVTAAIPGLSHVASLVTKSILDGAADAFLTLRVGVIAQTYCRAVTVVDRGTARRNATVAAASMLGSIVTATAGRIVSAIIAAAKKSAGSSIGAVTSAAQSAVSGIAGKLNPFG